MLPGGRNRSDSRQIARQADPAQHGRDPQFWPSALGRTAAERLFLRTDHDAAGVGLSRRWFKQHGVRCGERPRRTLIRAAVIYLSLLFSFACTRDPQGEFQRTEGLFLHGDLVRAQADAERASLYYSRQSPLWAWKFRLLSAKVLAWRGMYPEILKVLEAGGPPGSNDGELGLQKQI